MVFRAKSPDRVVDEVVGLAELTASRRFAVQPTTSSAWPSVDTVIRPWRQFGTRAPGPPSVLRDQVRTWSRTRSPALARRRRHPGPAGDQEPWTTRVPQDLCARPSTHWPTSGSWATAARRAWRDLVDPLRLPGEPPEAYPRDGRSWCRRSSTCRRPTAWCAYASTGFSPNFERAAGAGLSRPATDAGPMRRLRRAGGALADLAYFFEGHAPDSRRDADRGRAADAVCPRWADAHGYRAPGRPAAPDRECG